MGTYWGDDSVVLSQLQESMLNLRAAGIASASRPSSRRCTVHSDGLKRTPGERRGSADVSDSPLAFASYLPISLIGDFRGLPSEEPSIAILILRLVSSRQARRQLRTSGFTGLRGVADFFPAGDTVRVRPGFTPALKDENDVPLGNSRIGVCRSCQAVVYLDRSAAPPPGGISQTRKSVQFAGMEMRAIDAREPRSFFCCFSGDFDGSFDWVPRATRPMLCVNTDSPELIPKTNVVIRSSATEVISINDNGGQGGFDSIRLCYSEPKAQGPMQWILTFGIA